MSGEVRLPKLSQTTEEGIIVERLKREGEPVAEGEPLLQIETDKAVIEAESPASGLLAGSRHGNGDKVPVNTLLARIE